MAIIQAKLVLVGFVHLVVTGLQLLIFNCNTFVTGRREVSVLPDVTSESSCPLECHLSKWCAWYCEC